MLFFVHYLVIQKRSSSAACVNRAFVSTFFCKRHSSLGVEHSLSKRKVVGSNPACGFFFSNRARGLVVMIVACQVMDPGSIPGERTFASKGVLFVFLEKTRTQNLLLRWRNEPQAGLEPTTFRLLSECSTTKLLWHSR